MNCAYWTKIGIKNCGKQFIVKYDKIGLLYLCSARFQHVLNSVFLIFSKANKASVAEKQVRIISK